MPTDIPILSKVHREAINRYLYLLMLLFSETSQISRKNPHTIFNIHKHARFTKNTQIDEKTFSDTILQLW